jgi:TolB-like protein/Tfp pilus assembly protein PilF
MFSDIVGYSALMHESEKKAFRILEKNRNLHKTLIDLYHGKYLKEIGDGTLACFESASDAVRCATELQRVAREDPDLKLHVGIHLGEVIFSKDDVFGDGVNIASRIDAAAKEGEIYISEDVWKNIKNKEDINTEYLGKQKFKNFKEPIGLYKISADPPKTKKWKIRLEHKSLKKVFVGILILMVISASYYIYTSFEDNIASKVYDNSLVVLPFKNIVGDDEGEYFADGVTESIRSHLSKIKTLKVISGVSAAQYREPDKSATQIAAELEVVYLLVGSAQKFENNLQITVELINAIEDITIWSDIYKRELTDLFVIQSDIANEVADAMQAHITSEEYERITDIPTPNLEAYDLYVKGRYFWNKRTENDLLKSLDYFEDAIKIDPGFALAWSGKADTYNMLCGYGYMRSIDGHREAKIAAEHALELNPKSAEAYTALGWVNAFYNYDWAESMSSFELALEYEPSYSTAHSWYAWILVIQGNYDLAQQHILIARSLDPLSNIILASAGWIFYVSGSYEKAHDLFNSAIELNPDFPRFHMWMGWNYMVNHQYDSALLHLEKAVVLSNRHPQYLSGLGFCYGAAGQKDKAGEVLNEIMETSEKRYVSNYDIGLGLLGTGQEKLAIEFLEKAYQERDVWIPFMASDSRFFYLRDNPGFKEIIMKTGVVSRW